VICLTAHRRVWWDFYWPPQQGEPKDQICQALAFVPQSYLDSSKVLNISSFSSKMVSRASRRSVAFARCSAVGFYRGQRLLRKGGLALGLPSGFYLAEPCRMRAPGPSGCLLRGAQPGAALGLLILIPFVELRRSENAGSRLSDVKLIETFSV